MIALVAVLAVAAAVAFWPAKPTKTGLTLPQLAAPVVASAPSDAFRSSIDALAQVRGRLIATDLLDDKAKQAIDALTLALVSGSEKP